MSETFSIIPIILAEYQCDLEYPYPGIKKERIEPPWIPCNFTSYRIQSKNSIKQISKFNVSKDDE